MSHTPPSEPAEPFTWVAAPASFGDVWSDSEARAWVVGWQANYKGPPSQFVRRWEAGTFEPVDTELWYPTTLSGLAESDLWLAAGTGIEHYDGATWSVLASEPHGVISEAAPDDVWSCCSAVASTPAAYQAAHWDGERWTPSVLPILDGFSPTSIFNRSQGDVWIAGSGGYLLHGDGSTWQVVRDASVEAWSSVWGDAQKKYVWTIGGRAVARWDNRYVEQRLPTERVLASDIELYDVWGSGPDAIWVVGSSGTILSFKGSQLELEDSGTTASLLSVWGVASGVLWVAGSEETLLTREF